MAIKVIMAVAKLLKCRISYSCLHVGWLSSHQGRATIAQLLITLSTTSILTIVFQLNLG